MSEHTLRDNLESQINDAGVVDETSIGDLRTRFGSLKSRYDIVKDIEREEARSNGTRPVFMRVKTDKLI